MAEELELSIWQFPEHCGLSDGYHEEVVRNITYTCSEK